MNSSITDDSDMPVPRLSVVIASSNSIKLLERCVDALATQAAPVECEILVVRDTDRLPGDLRTAIAREHPHVQLLAAPRNSTVPHLRGIGMAAARAELIALLEDDCLVEPGWYEVASRSTSQDAAVGGAVEPGPYRRALDWAVYLCEYGRFMLPVPASARGPLTGNNVVYRRKAIAALPDASRSEFREAAVHDGWHRAGVATRVDGALVVRNVNAWSMPAVTASPFHHGRAYAAERFGGRSRLFRATVALLTVAMPAVKLVRLARETLGRGRFAGRMVVALPWILLFFGSWSMGEIVGCVAGSGDSRARWR